MKSRLIMMILGVAVMALIGFGISKAGDITGTGMSQGDLVTYLTNVKNLVNDLRTADLEQADRLKSQMLTSSGFWNTPAAATNSKIANASYGIANGTLFALAADTDVPWQTNVRAAPITKAKWNIACVYSDGAGTLTQGIGTEWTTLGGVVWPTRPSGKAVVGCTAATWSSAAFTWGTTAYNAGGVTLYNIAPVGAVHFSPSSTSYSTLSLSGL